VVDRQDRLYTVDLAGQRLLGFDRQGRPQTAWPLPPGYVPAPGCLAAGASVFLSDRRGLIYQYVDTQPQPLPGPARLPMNGVSLAADGALLVLHDRDVERVSLTGEPGTRLPLPAPATALRVPFGAVLGRSDGSVLVSDITRGQLLRVGRDGTALPAFGAPGAWTRPAGLAEDRYGRILVADPARRVLQRLNANGTPDVTWTAPSDSDGK
jgi:sugar lactone lactonase YvrE